MHFNPNILDGGPLELTLTTVGDSRLFQKTLNPWQGEPPWEVTTTYFMGWRPRRPECALTIYEDISWKLTVSYFIGGSYWKLWPCYGTMLGEKQLWFDCMTKPPMRFKSLPYGAVTDCHGLSACINSAPNFLLLSCMGWQPKKTPYCSNISEDWCELTTSAPWEDSPHEQAKVERSMWTDHKFLQLTMVY